MTDVLRVDKIQQLQILDLFPINRVEDGAITFALVNGVDQTAMVHGRFNADQAFATALDVHAIDIVNFPGQRWLSISTATQQDGFMQTVHRLKHQRIDENVMNTCLVGGADRYG